MSENLGVFMSDFESQATSDSIDSSPIQEDSSLNADVAGAVEEAQTIQEKKVEEVKKKLRKLDLKIDGETFSEELPFDLDDDPKAIEFMKKHLQMSKMAGKRAQETATLQKQVMGFVEQLKKDPRKALSDPRIGVDLKKLAYDMLNEEVENSKKSPEQIERENLEAELKALRDEREQEKVSAREKELERLQEQEFIRLDASFSQALEGSDLPKSPYVVKKMAEVMLVALENGMKVEPSQIIPVIRGEILDDMKQMFAAMPAEAVQELLGKDLIGKIRKGNVAKAKETQQIAKAKQIQDAGQGKKVESPGKKMTYKELFNF
jgi:hypothetical protein